MEPWIQTAYGHKFNLIRPTVDMVDERDLAHSLAHICRFNGHTSEYFSVAQHCVLVADLLRHKGFSPLHQFQGLLHDSSEAYLCDLPSPWKHATALGPHYRECETLLMHCIADWAGLEHGFDQNPAVCWADRISLLIEARDLMGNPDWAQPDEEMGKGFYPLPEGFSAKPISFFQGKLNFLTRFYALRNVVHQTDAVAKP
jgi:hypothetical protein